MKSDLSKLNNSLRNFTLSTLSIIKHSKLWCICCILLAAWILPIKAQPSGGPYGPIKQTYELPKTAVKIYYVAVDGKADQDGESISNPTTIESAIEKVKTGDAIILRGGIYRTGNLVLNSLSYELNQGKMNY